MAPRCRPCCTGGSGAFERGGKATTLELLPICVFLLLKQQKSTNTPQCGRRGGTLECVFHVEHSASNVPRGTSAYIYAAGPHKYSRIKIAYIFTDSINMQGSSGRYTTSPIFAAPASNRICIQSRNKYAGESGFAVTPPATYPPSCDSPKSCKAAPRLHPRITAALRPQLPRPFRAFQQRARRYWQAPFQGSAKRNPSIPPKLPPLHAPSFHAPSGHSSRVCSAHCWVRFRFVYVIFRALRQLSNTAVNL